MAPVTHRLTSFISFAFVALGLSISSTQARDEKSQSTYPTPKFVKLNSRNCETYQIEIYSPDKNLPNTPHVLMPVAVNFPGRGNEGFENTWWSIFTYDQILTFADNPQSGPLKDLPFVVVLFDFPESAGLSTDKEFSDYTCSVIQAFRSGNQHAFIDQNLSRTRFIIDRDSKWISSRLDAINQNKQQDKANGVFRPQTFVNPMLVELKASNRDLGFIYSGMNPLDLEQERIRKLRDLPADAPAEKLIELQREHFYGEVFRRIWVTNINTGESTASIADLILKTAVPLVDALNQGKIRINDQEKSFQREDVFAASLRQAYKTLKGANDEAFKNDLRAVVQEEWNQAYARQAQEFLDELSGVPSQEAKTALSTNMEVWLLASDLIITVRSPKDMQQISVEAAVRDVGTEGPIEYQTIPNAKDKTVTTKKIRMDEVFPLEENLREHKITTPFKEAWIRITEEGIAKEYRFPFLWTGEVTRTFIQILPSERLKLRSAFLFLAYSVATEVEQKLDEPAPDESKVGVGKGKNQAGKSKPKVEELEDLVRQWIGTNPTTDILVKNEMPAANDSSNWQKQNACIEEITKKPESVDLASLVNCYPGKVVVLDFGAPWCGPCRVAAKFSKKYVDENPDLVVLNIQLISLEKGVGEQERSSALIHARDLNFPTILLSKESQEALRLVDEKGKAIYPPIPNFIYRQRSGAILGTTVGGRISIDLVKAMLEETPDQVGVSQKVQDIFGKLNPKSDK